MIVELQYLLHHVVEDEHTEDDFTANNEEVPVADIADQLHRADLPGWDGTSCSRELHHQSVGEGRGLVGSEPGHFLPPPLIPMPSMGYKFRER
jgi:hypothetical protein